MTDDLREVLAEAYEAAGYRDEASAFRAGEWTCHDHPALHALRQVEQRAFERAAEVADGLATTAACMQVALELAGHDAPMKNVQRETAEALATAIRALAAPALIRDTKGGGL